MELQPQTGGISELGQTLKYHNGHNEIWWQRNWGKKSSEHCVYFVMLQTCSIFSSAIANVPSLLPEQAAQSKNMYLKHLSVYEESKHQAGSKAFLFVMNRSRERHRLLLGWQWKFGFLSLRLGKRIKRQMFNIFLGATFSICTWSLNTHRTLRGNKNFTQTRQEAYTFISESIKPKLLFWILKYGIYIVPVQSKLELIRKKGCVNNLKTFLK